MKEDKIKKIRKRRILFLGGGPAFPESIPFKEKYKNFSPRFCGNVLTPVAGAKNLISLQIGEFSVIGFPYITKNAVIRNVYTFWMFILHGIKLFRSSGFDVIVSPNPLISGVAGLLLRRLTRTKLIIEVNGNFESAFKFSRLGEPRIGIPEQIKGNVAERMIKGVLKRADMVKLVHSKQLVSLGIEKDQVKITVFPNFVPIERFIEASKRDEKYILLLGFPWYLKGVDILIKAFKAISDQFPEYSLKIVGWCPSGREYFESLAGGDPKIELCDAVEYERVIELMSGCSLYVLASRTDSSPRVLREAMASKKPIIASNIDGVPELIVDGYNGLLFEKENIADLSQKIALLLKDQALANRLAENGFKYVQEKLSEEVYLANYASMIENVLH